MIVVAGNPRSGTSLTMLLFKTALGEERIIGDEFPQKTRRELFVKKQDGESEEHYRARMYAYTCNPDNSEEALNKSIDMNPNGFWECPFTVQGIKNNRHTRDLIEQIENEDKDNPYVIKLVNSGLFNSDAKYIDKVIYLVRHPKNIAKSQENLKRSMKFSLKGKDYDLYDGVVVNDPLFYLQSTCQFAQWKEENKDVPTLFIEFDDLISNPAEELEKIALFTGEPDLIKAAKMINPKLRRSTEVVEETEGLWAEAEQVHKWLRSGDFKSIVEYAKDPKTWKSKRDLVLTCTRSRCAVAYLNCFDCRFKQDKEFIQNNIKRAELNGWDWRNEPCLFECGFDPDDEEPLTLEESIRTNHWLPFAN